MTTIETRWPEAADLTEISPAEGREIALAPAVAKGLPLVAATLCERFSGLAAATVERHVHAAAVELTDHARIHDYLPILIERRAAASLRRNESASDTRGVADQAVPQPTRRGGPPEEGRPVGGR